MKKRKNSYGLFVLIAGVFILLLELWLAINVREKNKKNPNTEKSEQVIPK